MRDNSIFNSNNPEQFSSGFIDIGEILSYIDEEEIFSLVFGYLPKEGDYDISPFREDNNPECYFVKDNSGKLVFADFGSTVYKRNKKWVYFDCFDAVQFYFKFNNLYQTLNFIKEKLIVGKSLKKKKKKIVKKQEKEKVRLSYEPRNYLVVDKEYWFDRYYISKEDLIEDKVLPLNRYFLFKDNSEKTFYCKTPSYAFTDFESRNVKIYSPFKKRGKFISTCTPEDIGGLRLLDYERREITITSSYKDYRVLKNFNLNPIWFSSETVLPSMKVLLPILYKFDRIRIFFDNDRTGINSAERLKEIIESFFPESETYLNIVPKIKENITDPSDFIMEEGRESFLAFLLDRGILIN